MEAFSWQQEEYRRHRAYCLTYEIADATNDGNFDRADMLRDEQDSLRERIRQEAEQGGQEHVR